MSSNIDSIKNSQNNKIKVSNSIRHPKWMKRKIPLAGQKSVVQQSIQCRSLHTVCEEARCPNRAECYAQGTATFLIMGDRCSRQCRFCSVDQRHPYPLDPDEPRNIADAVEELKLSYVVLTSVTRDDLADGGALHFSRTIRELHQRIPNISVEVLVPDFQGKEQDILSVLNAGPDVFNHNVETVVSLYPKVRPQAQYERSLSVLNFASRNTPNIPVKSGIMVGLGETPQEVETVLRDLKEAGCSIVTIGQYLQPSPNQLPVEEYISPEQFNHYSHYGLSIGLDRVVASPFVRSSYKAHEVFTRLTTTESAGSAGSFYDSLKGGLHEHSSNR